MPHLWAPLQLIAVQGLRRYGFSEAAVRIAMKLLSLVRDDYPEWRATNELPTSIAHYKITKIV